MAEKQARFQRMGGRVHPGSREPDRQLQQLGRGTGSDGRQPCPGRRQRRAFGSLPAVRRNGPRSISKRRQRPRISTIFLVRSSASSTKSKKSIWRARRVVHNNTELSRALDEKKLALVHAVEGGFHLGTDPSTIAANVCELADRGVAYITVAHLFWRHVASNAPAPSVSARCVVQAPLSLARRRPTDLWSCSHRSHDEEPHPGPRHAHDRGRHVRRSPVAAAHAPTSLYMAAPASGAWANSTDRIIRKIVRRGGLLGVILCDHFWQ